MSPSNGAITADQLAMLVMSSGISGLTGTVITGDEVQFHRNGETWMTLPVGMTYERAAEILAAKQKEEEAVISFDRTFRYRPDDGAVAAAEVLKSLYGLTIGLSTWFKPPQIRTIAIGVNKTRQVPWGLIEIPALKGASITLDMRGDADYGPVFHVDVFSPKKHKVEIERLFDAIDVQLREHSIYRGKALVGADELEFLDASAFDPTRIVFSDDVTATLDAGLFGAIEHADALRTDGIPLKRALLLHGPYGTGKSSVGMMTAQVAERFGWTFLMARTGKDKIADVMRTAKLYQPAVVFVEDIDTQSSSSKPQEVSALLETFDGVTAKGTEIMLVMTTNKVEEIHAGMMRPGRLDFIVEIATLDRNGTERLIRAVVDAAKIASDVDFDALYKEMTDFEPAFVKAVADRAKTFALVQAQGKPDYLLTTRALVASARSLHPQLERLRLASEGKTEPEITAALESLVGGTVTELIDKVRIVDRDGDHYTGLRVGEESYPLR